MRRMNVSAKLFSESDRLVYRQVGRRDQQRVELADYLVLAVHYILLTEYLGAVFDRHKMLFYLGIKAHSVVKLAEEAHEMYILGSGELHTRNGDYSLLLARLKEGGAVFCGIMVGKGKYLQALECRHSRYIIRSHIVIRAG